MSFIIQVKDEAKQDITDAMAWYASKVEMLDQKFFKAVEETIFRIQRNPFSYKRIYKKFRQAAVKRFPYVILYEPEQKNVVIYAVFNTWQHPGKKIKRLK